MTPIRKGSDSYFYTNRPLLGNIDEFPFTIHGKAILKHNIPNNHVRKLVIEALYSLNGLEEDVSLSVSGRPGSFIGKQRYIVEVGYGTVFINLNEEIVKKLFHSTSSSQRFLDFQIVLTYHYIHEGKKIPLRFDQLLIRHVFLSKKIAIMLVHIKGIRRTPLVDFLSLIVKKIDQSFQSGGFNGLTIDELRGL